MPRLAPPSVRKLHARAVKLNRLVDKKNHPRVRLAAQTAYGGLMAAAETTALLYRVSSSAAGKAAASRGAAGLTKLQLGLRSVHLPRAIDALKQADDLAAQRDTQVLKTLAGRSVSLAISIAAQASGIIYIKTAADIAGALKEAVGTGQALRLRKDQAKEASKFLRWVDATHLLTMAWCYSAEEILLGLSARRIPSSNAVMDRVLKRMKRKARSWR